MLLIFLSTDCSTISHHGEFRDRGLAFPCGISAAGIWQLPMPAHDILSDNNAAGHARLRIECLCAVYAGAAVLYVDSIGRRPLLLGGVSGMVLALCGLGAANLLLQGGAATWTSVAALLVYVGAYQACILAAALFDGQPHDLTFPSA